MNGMTSRRFVSAMVKVVVVMRGGGEKMKEKEDIFMSEGE